MTTAHAVPGRCRLPPHQRLSFLCALSGLCGFAAGAGLTPDWQVSVEAGQVLAGVVQYPSSAIPQYIYLVKTWTLVSQISAILLQLGFSEARASMIIAGLVGAVSFMALTTLCYSVSRNTLVSLLTPFFIGFMSYVGFGVVYPIFFLDSPHTYGRIGLVFIVLVFGLFASGHIKTGSFCLGVAPCVHPSTGAYCISIMILVLLLFHRDYAGRFRQMAVWFAAGFAVTLVSFAVQYQFLRDLPSFNSPERQAFVISFIRHWDYHRVPFTYLSPGFVIALLGAAVSVVALRFRTRDGTLSPATFRIYVVSFLVSTAASLITLLPPEILPGLHAMMPGRFMNVSNIMLMPLLFGLLTARNATTADRLLFSGFVLVTLGLKVALPHTTVTVAGVSKDIQVLLKLLFMVGLPLAFLVSLVRPALFDRLAVIPPRAAAALYHVSHAALLLLAAIMLVQSMRADSAIFDLSDPVLVSVTSREGLLLLATESAYLVHMKVRRPTLIDPGALDGFLYAPESAPHLNRILNTVYGLDLLVPPPRPEGQERHSGTIPCVYRDRWEQRDADSWKKIGAEFGVTDILTPGDWHLSLPVLARNETYAHYTITDTTTVESGND